LTQILKITSDVKNLDKLTRFIDIVEKFANSRNDLDFQKYLQDKVLQTVRQVSYDYIENNTNQEYFEEYVSRHSIREEANGFVLYNDFAIPAILSTKNTKNQDRDLGIVRNYDDGFSIALAFEYGVGIVGQDNPVQGAWEYNINQYGKGGWYYKALNGEVMKTEGYHGFEIYRHTAERIQENLKGWIEKYGER